MTSNADLRANELALERMLEETLEDCMSSEVVQGLLDEAMVTVRPQKRNYIEQDREVADKRLMRDYFNRNPVYMEVHFFRRFRMPRDVFICILHALEDNDEYRRQRVDAVGKVSLSPYQKCIAAIRKLCYGIMVDVLDEYLKIGESTTLECVIKFCRGVVTIFGPTYPFRSTLADMNYILSVNETCGFPRMFGSLDCMHWEWKNLPTALRGLHSRRDHENRATMVHEAVVTRDLWIGTRSLS